MRLPRCSIKRLDEARFHNPDSFACGIWDFSLCGSLFRDALHSLLVGPKVKAYLLLGKAGDIVGVLPCLHADFIETGHKPHLIISKRYSSIVEGLDYLEPVIWQGDWEDVSGALLWAKHTYGEVVVAQMHARDFVPRRVLPSFQLDQWQRCGRLEQWGTLPLVYPVEKGLQKPSNFILVGDKGESAPFPKIEEIIITLTKEFPQHRIVRLSDWTLSFSELLALYDAADLIVTIDTLHSHLTMASKTPLIVLSNDKPSRWHGIPFHPRMAMMCRYGDYDLKKEQLIHTAKQIVDKSIMPVVRTVQTANKFGYNMSMMKVGNNIWKTYRHHPEKGWRTVLSLVREGMEFPIKPPSKYDKHSIEDGRLFWFKGKPHISVTVARSKLPGTNFDPCIQAFGELTPEGSIINWIEPRVGKNDWSGTEKNWVFFESGGKLHVTYSHSPAHVVYELDDKGSKKQEYRSAVPVCSFGEPRGGTQHVQYNGQWLKFFHTNQVNLKSDARQNYHMGAMVMEKHPPFRITKISRQPILSGNELYSPAPRWKPKCRLCYGVLENTGAWEISMGANDCSCEIAYVWPENLNL